VESDRPGVEIDMKSFINIEINNSFNKKDDSHKNEEKISNNSTLNNNKNLLNITSDADIGSITAYNDQSFENNISSKINQFKENKSIIKEIFIGVLSAVLGSIITYLILGIK
jgi:hypothetical protein